VNILRESLTIGIIAIVYVLPFYSPGDLESTGEPTGDAVCNRNRNVVTNDQLHNPCFKGGLEGKTFSACFP